MQAPVTMLRRLGATSLVLVCAGQAAPAWAAPPPAEEMAAAEAEQDKALSEAQRGGSTARVVKLRAAAYVSWSHSWE